MEFAEMKRQLKDFLERVTESKYSHLMLHVMMMLLCFQYIGILYLVLEFALILFEPYEPFNVPNRITLAPFAYTLQLLLTARIQHFASSIRSTYQAFQRSASYLDLPLQHFVGLWRKPNQLSQLLMAACLWGLAISVFGFVNCYIGVVLIVLISRYTLDTQGLWFVAEYLNKLIQSGFSMLKATQSGARAEKNLDSVLQSCREFFVSAGFRLFPAAQWHVVLFYSLLLWSPEHQLTDRDAVLARLQEFRPIRNWNDFLQFVELLQAPQPGTQVVSEVVVVYDAEEPSLVSPRPGMRPG